MQLFTVGHCKRGDNNSFGEYEKQQQQSDRVCQAGKQSCLLFDNLQTPVKLNCSLQCHQNLRHISLSGYVGYKGHVM